MLNEQKRRQERDTLSGLETASLVDDNFNLPTTVINKEQSINHQGPQGKLADNSFGNRENKSDSSNQGSQGNLSPINNTGNSFIDDKVEQRLTEEQRVIDEQIRLAEEHLKKQDEAVADDGSGEVIARATIEDMLGDLPEDADVELELATVLTGEESENDHSFHWDGEKITNGYYLFDDNLSSLPSDFPTNGVLTDIVSVFYYIEVDWGESNTNSSVYWMKDTSEPSPDAEKWIVPVLDFDSDGVCTERLQSDIIIPSVRIVDPPDNNPESTYKPYMSPSTDKTGTKVIWDYPRYNALPPTQT
jgi:hypothetical protein